MGFEPMASASALQCSTSLSYEDPYTGGRPIYWVHQPVKGMKHRMKWCELQEYSSHHFIVDFISKISVTSIATVSTLISSEIPIDRLLNWYWWTIGKTQQNAGATLGWTSIPSRGKLHPNLQYSCYKHPKYTPILNSIKLRSNGAW